MGKAGQYVAVYRLQEAITVVDVSVSSFNEEIQN
jgi:hypothetical protein